MDGSLFGCEQQLGCSHCLLLSLGNACTAVYQVGTSCCCISLTHLVSFFSFEWPDDAIVLLKRIQFQFNVTLALHKFQYNLE